ncbi:hypothetical protein [Nesterenkonia sp.]|uniref:hypothetical protein n=1 Tax=Nesterenkonia sp. TaxID=704201 RepID=UPI00262EAA7E|nr:hypothetical protein [Nesterenkonia sp.]
MGTLRLTRLTTTLKLAWVGLKTWSSRQAVAAVIASVAVAVSIGVATVLIPNPVFGRDIAPVVWNYPVWILASALTGMLIATYVHPSPAAEGSSRSEGKADRSGKLGLTGGILAWFAVGCPVCNKLALLALGYSGAITWFTPVQPFLATAAILLSGLALIIRLKGQVACTVKPATVSVHADARERVGA